MAVEKITHELERLGSPEGARLCKRFFKTGPGDYSEHDLFRGIPVPVLRKFAKTLDSPASLGDIGALLQSKFHEDRALSLILLTNLYERTASQGRGALHKFYLRNAKQVNNWDLVDMSAPQLVGDYLSGLSDRSILRELIRSSCLWERRIAIVSTLGLMRHGSLDETFELAPLLFSDKEDLLHKATGWMLREAGKRDETRLLSFLRQHSGEMPRTMLRYALERLAKEVRKSFLLIASGASGAGEFPLPRE